MIDKNFLKKMKETLLQQKKIIASSDNVSQDIDVEGDETDEIQANIILELASQLNTRNNAKLAQINDALQKIENKTYGFCEDCGDEIAEKRLLLSPYSVTCIFCAEEREIADKQRKRI